MIKQTYKRLSFLFFRAFMVMLPVQLFSQLPLVRADSIPVSLSGEPMGMPWAGGFNSPQFSEIDLDGDGTDDLFVLERNFYGMVKTFINKGTASLVDYRHDPFYQTAFPPLSNWALLVDYNCDGKKDIFASVPAGIAVYRNDFSPQEGLQFTQVTSLLRTSTSLGQEILYVSPPDIPSITDVDKDGDLDILTFDILGRYVEYHQNMSIENNGNCEELVFQLRDPCWGYFSENETDNGINLQDTCPGKVPLEIKDSRHAGSTLLALDLDGNGVKDLLLGDIAHDNMVKLTNGGSPTAASMVAVDTAFPSGNTPVDLTTFPAAFYLDVNNDQLKDLLVSPNNPNTSVNTHSAWYYQNTGTSSQPEFTFRKDDFLQSEMIDVGEGARPVFFDFDNDGLLDIVIGNFGYFVEAGAFESRLALYRNSGTMVQPAFELVEADYAGLSEFNFDGVYPAFGDLDGDEDLDMLIGDENGNLHLFTNIAQPGDPANFVLSGPNYKNIDIGQTAMPQIVDVDRDGLPDLLIGERSGTLNYFRNTGSSGEANFSALPTNDFFGGIDVMLECCTGYSAPYLTIDSVGKPVLYVGSEKGVLYLYNNIENNLDGQFSVVDSLNLYGLNINLSGGDINSDGKEEFVYGEYAGGIAVLKDGQPEFIGITEVNETNLIIKVYPNPASSLVTLEILNPHQINCRLRVTSIHGKQLLLSDTFQERKTIDLSDFQKGLYLILVTSEDGNTIAKKLLLK